MEVWKAIIQVSQIASGISVPMLPQASLFSGLTFNSLHNESLTGALGCVDKMLRHIKNADLQISEQDLGIF